MRAIALLLAAVLAIAPVEGATKRHIVSRHSPDAPYGVFINLTAQSDPTQIGRALDLAAADGIRWVRIQFSWSAIQATPGTANYNFYNQIVNRAVKDKLNVLGLIAYSAQWNTTAPASETRLAQREHYPPADYNAWGAFVSLTVKTFKDRVHFWEIWNEPDLGFPPDATHVCNGFWCGTPAQYAHLLSVAYTSIKAADPTAVVLLGGLALDGIDNPTFLVDILTDPDYPAGDSFDVMNYHSYGSKNEALKRINYVKSHMFYGSGGLKPIWITEFGYGSDPAVQNVAPYYGGESGQAAYVTDMAPYLRSLGIQKLFWFQLFDGTSATDPFASYGLLTSALEKKQAYDAYFDVIKASTQP